MDGDITYLTLQGLAVGSLYGMIALGVVLIYKTSEVLNFAHGNMGMFITFCCYTLMEKHMPRIIVAVNSFSGGGGGIEGGLPLTLAFILILVIIFISAFILGAAIEFFTLRPITKWKVILFIAATLAGCIFFLIRSNMPAFYSCLIFFIFFVIEFFTMGPAKEPTQLGLIVVTIGLWLALDGVASSRFGTQDHALPNPMGPENFKMIAFWNIEVSQLDLIILVITALLIVLLFFFFRFSKVGTAMRATSQVESAARLMGIKTKRIFALTWGMSSVLGAIAGILTAAKFYLNTNTMLFPFLKAFAAATMGGLTSLPGAIIGGWILGITENLFGFYVSMDLKTPFAFLVIVIVLCIRPSGLLARHYVKKV
ncbi:MAG: branched-chain amino acid ABC transporter permease [Deltaproteobacteria bacterium]|uniref:Branched-chain amino acid ABC transporter permease n=1 Tax=Candidatus Zymogenus saltonus TaxID=2844893 RepID=A0A9D8KH83_9DELT|nr:branched-chain amino acid ABC transporter permease [Candidatus Zymogenus saltonus]